MQSKSLTNPSMQGDIALEEKMTKRQEEAKKTLAGVLQGSESESQSEVCTKACKQSRTQMDQLRSERKRTVSALELHVHYNKSDGRRQILFKSAKLNCTKLIHDLRINHR